MTRDIHRGLVGAVVALAFMGGFLARSESATSTFATAAWLRDTLSEKKT